MNDQEAIALAINGREEGFKAIFENHSAYMFTHALRFLRNQETAEDVVQETFKDAFRFIQSFKGDSSLRTWLYKILFRKVIKASEKREPMKLEYESGKEDSSYRKAELRIDMAEVLDQLPEKDRAILMLAYWDDLRLNEIAEILGISLTNAKVVLFRARKKFGQHWIKARQKGERTNEM